jgi:hypothetical protein
VCEKEIGELFDFCLLSFFIVVIFIFIIGVLGGDGEAGGVFCALCVIL